MIVVALPRRGRRTLSANWAEKEALLELKSRINKPATTTTRQTAEEMMMVFLVMTNIYCNRGETHFGQEKPAFEGGEVEILFYWPTDNEAMGNIFCVIFI